MTEQGDNQLQSKKIKESSEKLLPPSENKYIICCFSEKWCFKHQGLPIIKEYDETYCLCFRFLDCCTWCLEFKQKKTFICYKKTVCFICCCSITYE
jgi:hypothetical protein